MTTLSARRGWMRALAPAAILSVGLISACSNAGTGSTDSTEAAGATQSSAASSSAQSCLDDKRHTMSQTALPHGWVRVTADYPRTALHATPSLPTTVTDGTGTSVEIHDASRIISAGDGVSATLGALGLAGNIAAAPENSTSPEGECAPEHFAFNKSTGAEGLLAMNGTLFIGDNSKRHGDVAKQFRDAHTDAVVLDDKKPQVEKIQDVADFVGAADTGKELVAAINKDFDEAKKLVADNDLGSLRIIQVTATGAGGQNSVAGVGAPGTELVETLGLTSVGKESGFRGFSREFSNEGILSSAPDVIILAESDLSKWGGADGLFEAFPTLKDTPAGTANRIIVLPDSFIRYTSPQIGEGAQALAKALLDTKK